MRKRRRQDYKSCSVNVRDGKLRLRYRWSGQARSHATGLPATPENRRAVERLAAIIGTTIKAGVDPRAVIKQHVARKVVDTDMLVAPVKAVTVRSYYDAWIAEQVPPLVRKAQARDYRRHVGEWVVPTLGDVELGNLRPVDVRGLQAELLAQGLSVKYVKNIISGSLRAMIGQAIIDELVTRDVFAGLKWPKWQPPEADPLLPEERTRVVEWFQIKRFSFHGGSSKTARRYPHPPYAAYVLTLFWTGLRPSEASGLMWGDVDLLRARLHVQRSRHLYEYGAPKTASADRWVELFPAVVEALRAIQPLHTSPETPVFTTTTGTPIEPKSFSSHWYRCLRALGVRQRGLYCTKDTFVTTALQAGVRIAWLEAQTGVNYATLRKHYGKWLPLDGESELDRFAASDPALFESTCVRSGHNRRAAIAKSQAAQGGRGMRGGGLEPPRVLPH